MLLNLCILLLSVLLADSVALKNHNNLISRPEIHMELHN
jgi:hypothetical protein